MKPLRKALYIRFVKMLRAQEGVIWHASSDYEASDITRLWSTDSDIRIAPPLQESDTTAVTALRGPLHVISSAKMTMAERGTEATRFSKEAGRLDIVFLSRVSRMKNLDGALAMLTGLRGTVKFDIYGPAEDREYWAECSVLIDLLPQNVSVHYHGQIPHDGVRDILCQHHLLFLPTRGESYGHVIAEALSAGRPVLVSDQTPWRNLESYGAGWALPLDQSDRFQAVLQRCIDMNDTAFVALCAAAKKHISERFNPDQVLQQNRELFFAALARNTETSRALNSSPRGGAA